MAASVFAVDGGWDVEPIWGRHHIEGNIGTLIPTPPRSTCLRCRRPRSVCYCALLPRIPTRTRLVFLQHPRERRVAVGTARMAHLSLPNSEFHQGVNFGDRPAIASLAHKPRTAVLFPGAGSDDVSSLEAGAIETLVVLDGTWPLARKLLKQNPSLQALPRVHFTPKRPGNYRIRREPAAHCVSTVEAVAEVLGRLEGEPEQFERMLVAFEKMVDWQIEHRHARLGPPRRRQRKPHRGPAFPQELLQSPERVVLFYAEANAYAARSVPHFAPELVHLVAQRPASGERFEAVVAPRVPLAPRTAEYLELPEIELQGGESLASAVARWSGFVREDDTLCGWGYFAQGLAHEAGFAVPAFFDLRLSAARLLRERPGDVERAPARFGTGVGQAWARGRAGRRLAAIEAVAGALVGAAQAARLG